jgi:hypothetical protein
MSLIVPGSGEEELNLWLPEKRGILKSGEPSRLQGSLLHHWVSRYERMSVENPGPSNIRYAEDKKVLNIKKESP